LKPPIDNTAYDCLICGQKCRSSKKREQESASQLRLTVCQVRFSPFQQSCIASSPSDLPSSYPTSQISARVAHSWLWYRPHLVSSSLACRQTSFYFSSLQLRLPCPLVTHRTSPLFQPPPALSHRVGNGSSSRPRLIYASGLIMTNSCKPVPV
jgi:hypothetical protein